MPVYTVYIIMFRVVNKKHFIKIPYKMASCSTGLHFRFCFLWFIRAYDNHLAMVTGCIYICYGGYKIHGSYTLLCDVLEISAHFKSTGGHHSLYYVYLLTECVLRQVF